MPSERHRSKEDTWTTDELNRALKRDDGRRHRDKDESKRKERHRDEVNGDSRRRKDDEDRRHHRDRDEDRRSHRDDDREKNDSGDGRRLTEEERERQRRERREKREGKSKGEDDRKKTKDYDSKRQKLIIDDDDDDRDKKKGRDDDRRREEERERRRQQREAEDKKRRHPGDDDRDKRRHRDEEDREKRKPRDEDDREKRRHHREDDEEKENRRKRDEEREKRHREKGEDREKERREREEERERRHKEREDERERRRREKDGEKRHHDDDDDRDRRRHHRDKDNDDRRHRGKDDDDDRRRRHRDRDDDDRDRRKDRRHKEPKEAEDDVAEIDEDERERQRRERREKKEGGKDKDRRKRDEEEEYRRRKEQEREERKAREREEEERRLQNQSNERAKSSRYGRGGKAKQEEDEYNYDDDDFEDYEEDFEEDDDDDNPKDSEMNDLLKALDKENERLLEESRATSARRRLKNEDVKDTRDNDRHHYVNSDEEPEQPKISRSRTLINFVGAKKRVMTNQANSIMGKRAQDLLQMVSLDTSEFDMFDMPPVKEYDLYIRSFGRTDTTQAYIQTGDDDIEREVQTDEIETRQKWTQHPPEDFNGCGRGDGEKDIEEEEESKMNKQQDLSRLSKFVQKACQAVSILLEEEEDESKMDVNANKSNVGLSESYTQLSMLSILKGRYVQFAQFSPTQPNMLITAYSKPREGKESSPINSKGIVCVWNTNDPKYPHRILACESQPTCCCFSPYKTSLAFAGMVDGSICVWDLREPSSLHRSISFEDTDFVLRTPTYNTASVLESENHHSPVITLNPVASYAMSDPNDTEAKDNTGAGLSFQLVSCEEQGIINFWVVAEITNPDMAGSETDLGISPGGRIKLVHSSFITLKHPTRFKKAGESFKVFEMQLAPTDPNHIYIATDCGYVLHCLRFGNRAYPSCYSTISDVPIDINSLDFSPFGHPCFLVTCNDGSVHLYNTKSESPLVTWPSKIWDSNKLTCVRWSRSRPCVFYVLDCASRLYTFDILEGDAMPVKIDNLSHDQVMHIAFSTENKSHNRHPQMLVSLATGQTEIHTIAKDYREEQTLENDFLPSFLQRF